MMVFVREITILLGLLTMGALCADGAPGDRKFTKRSAGKPLVPGDVGDGCWGNAEANSFRDCKSGLHCDSIDNIEGYSGICVKESHPADHEEIQSATRQPHMPHNYDGDDEEVQSVTRRPQISYEGKLSKLATRLEKEIDQLARKVDELTAKAEANARSLGQLQNDLTLHRRNDSMGGLDNDDVYSSYPEQYMEGGYLYNYDSLQGVYNEKGERIYGDPEDYSIDGGNEPNDGEDLDHGVSLHDSYDDAYDTISSKY